MIHEKRILVTGGAGFLGSHLCERLLAEGHRVFCLDNFQTGRLKNISHLLVHRNFRLLKHDVVEPLELRVDEIYNLACPASPVHYQADPIQTLKTSVYGAVNLLDLAVRHKARILQTSTSEVYGDPEKHTQCETYWGNVNPDGVRACYDEGKRCAETLFFDYQRRYGVKIKIARIFNTYGPRMDPDDGRVVSNFVVQALKQQPLTVYGDGHQTRSFCFAKDMVDGLVTLMESPPGITGPLNLGNPHEVTVLHLAKRVLVLTHSQSHIQFESLPQDDPVRRQPDISRAHALLGWQPTTNLNTGLRATITYFRKQLEENRLVVGRCETSLVDPATRGSSRVMETADDFAPQSEDSTRLVPT
ncbi:MAG: SDR family oxidoreductase [Planctomycetaceae bacterium]|nr:MAG: SDR family oxidoreductase [Planctomycetaceae bacterium]